jgi:lysophospholipase L1-like esterase
MGRGRGVAKGLATVSLAAGVSLATSLVLDRVAGRLDVGFRPRRNAPSADFRVERSEFSFRVVTNPLGFRDPRLPVRKPGDVGRVVVVGDSFTQGYGVGEEEAFPRRLEALLRAEDDGRQWEVVNLGVPGTNPRDYAGNLRDVGLAYEPDVVLVAVGANDVHDVRVQPRSGSQFGWERLGEAQRAVLRPQSAWRALPRRLWPVLYPIAHARLAALFDDESPEARDADDSPPAPSPSVHVLDARWRDVLLAFADAYGRRAEVAGSISSLPAERLARIRRVLSGETDISSEEGEEDYWSLVALVQPDLMSEAVLLPPSYDDAWKRTAARLRAAVRLARRADARVVMTLVPDQHQVTARGRDIMDERGFRWDPRVLSDTTLVDRLRALAAAEGATFIDLLDDFRARADEALYFPRDGHWTAAGHDLAARVLAADLERHGDLVPCGRRAGRVLTTQSDSARSRVSLLSSGVE